MKNIILSRGYFITVERDGNILLKHTTTPNYTRGRKPASEKEEIEVFDGYYSSFEGALMAYRKKAIQRELSEADSITLSEAVAKVAAMTDELITEIKSAKLDGDILEKGGGENEGS